MPEVTVITSYYDRRRTLKRSVLSVLDQSFKDIELIVVDDCSPTPASEVLKGIDDPRLRIVRLDRNSGHDGKPKNLGIREAKGDYVTFLDDDDAYKKDALKILHTYAKETRHPVVYGDYMNRLKGECAVPGWSLEFDPARLTKHNFISMCTAIVERDWLLKVGGFDEDVCRFKDWNLWLRLYKAGAEFFHVPIIVTDVYPLKKSVSSKFKAETDESGTLLPTWFSPADCLIFPERGIGEHRLKVAVYTLTCGRLDYMKRMRESLMLAGYPFDWIVVDDASRGGTKDWLKSLPKEDRWQQSLKSVRNPKRLGLAKSWNIGVEAALETGADIVVKADDDAIFLTDGWLKAMVEVFERNQRVCLSPTVEGLEGSPGGVLRERGGASPYLMVDEKVIGSVPHLGGIVYATPRRLWDAWRIPEEGEGNRDTLLSLHARQSGNMLGYLEEFRCSHGPGGTLQQAIDYPNGTDL